MSKKIQQINLILISLILLTSVALLVLVKVKHIPLFNSAILTEAPQSVQTSSNEQTKLMPYKNHNIAAAAYAYDVETIRQYIRGEQPYYGENLVFLTIDDGANDEITPAILDILKKEEVHATFFPIGANVTEEHAALYARQIHEGHAIGLHSFTHNIHLLYPGGFPNQHQIIWESIEAQKAFQRLLGLKFQTRVWRYPGGAMSWHGLESTHYALKEQGLEWIDWNASIGDAEPEYRRPHTLDEMIDFHTWSLGKFPESPDNLKVVLIHDADDKKLTVEALPYIIQYYKEQGYTFGVLE